MQVRDNRVDRKNITAARINNDGSFGKAVIEISSVAEAGAVFANYQRLFDQPHTADVRALETRNLTSLSCRYFRARTDALRYIARF